nr:MAG TPA: CAAD domains of cyanobacterial aminoacyl-tRNA synthetase [Bacteriophage sp.]
MEHWGTKATKPINLSSLVTALNSIPLIGVVREVLHHMTM